MSLHTPQLPAGLGQPGRWDIALSGWLGCTAGVELHFQDGGSVTAGVVVGADGYFSQVRQQLLQDGPPSFGVSTDAPSLASTQRCAALPTEGGSLCNSASSAARAQALNSAAGQPWWCRECGLLSQC